MKVRCVSLNGAGQESLGGGMNPYPIHVCMAIMLT